MKVNYQINSIVMMSGVTLVVIALMLPCLDFKIMEAYHDQGMQEVGLGCTPGALA